MLDAIIQKCSDYYDAIPADTMPKVLQSAFFNFTATWIMYLKPGAASGNMERALKCGGAGALASLIYGLTTPLFNYAFGNNRIEFAQEIIKGFVITCTTSALVNYLTTGKVELVSMKIIPNLPLNYFIGIIQSMADFNDWATGGGPNPFSDLLRSTSQFLGGAPGTSSIFLCSGDF